MNMMTITSTENKRAAVIQAAAAALALRVKSATIKIIEGQLQKKGNGDFVQISLIFIRRLFRQFPPVAKMIIIF